jgi:hypothetical protein
MSASAIFMGFLGLACTFAPDEIQLMLSEKKEVLYPILIQMLGALYFAFAMLNWFAKANLIGGIYSKPVAIGNFTHFLMVTLALIKFFIAHQEMTILLVPIVIYAIFTVGFSKVVFKSPI